MVGGDARHSFSSGGVDVGVGRGKGGVVSNGGMVTGGIVTGGAVTDDVVTSGVAGGVVVPGGAEVRGVG